MKRLRHCASRKASASRIVLIAFCFVFSTTFLHKNMVSLSLSRSVQHDDMPKHVDVHEYAHARTPLPRSTLVHFDPHFMGGFRNQHMRFVAFVARAVGSNVSQILLPSLRWMDHVSKQSIRHELLFDVDYWNSRADGMGLPLLVDYDPDVLEGIIGTDVVNANGSLAAAAVVPCWNETSGLFSGLDEALLRNPTTNLRRIPTWDLIGQGEPFSHCRRLLINIEEDARRRRGDKSNNSTLKVERFTHLIPHGGSHGSGRLWTEYNGLQKNRRKASWTTTDDNQTIQIHPEHVSVEKAIYELLRPREYLRSVAKNAVRDALRKHKGAARDEDSRGTKTDGALPRLLALHPRVEQDMIGHRCSKFMEKNLTRVFERLRSFPPLMLEGDDGTGGYIFDLVFVAVSKKLVEQNSTRGGELGKLIDANRIALNDTRNHGLFSGGSTGGNGNGTVIPIFESGTGSAAKIRFPRIGPSGALRSATGSHSRIYAHTAPEGNASEEAPFVTATDLGVSEMVASVINFFTAVEADIFVGVRGSSFFTDVFTVRYYQRKEVGGGENYILRPEGITRLYGPPGSHDCANG